MPDSKGELKRYSIERNGQLYPFIDGEVVLASQALAALSTAEQRIEELRATAKKSIYILASQVNLLEDKLSKADATIAEWKLNAEQWKERHDQMCEQVRREQTTIAALRAEREKELRGFQEFAIDRIVSMLEEYHASGWDVVADRRGEPEQEQFDIIGYLKTFGAAPADMVAAFLAQKEGK